MTIAVMSDLHDNVAAWELLHRELARRQLDTLINCGDTIAPAMLAQMAEMFTGRIHTVFGNNADRKGELAVVAKLGNITHYGVQGAVEIEGRRIGFNHFPEVAMAMVGMNEFDLVCHGHTHLRRWEKIQDSWVLNPGTAGGMFQYPSFATVDLATMECSFVDLIL